MPLYPHKLNTNLLNTCRLYVIPANIIDFEFIHKRLSRGQWISYDNEIQASVLLRFTVNAALTRAKLSYKDILYSLTETRHYYKSNKEEIDKKPMMRFKYRLRRRIMEVLRENRNTHYKNLNFAHDKIEEVLADQFVKMKQYYTSL